MRPASIPPAPPSNRNAPTPSTRLLPRYCQLEFFELKPPLSTLFEHDLRANASRLSRGKPVPTFPDHALTSENPNPLYPAPIAPRIAIPRGSCLGPAFC